MEIHKHHEVVVDDEIKEGMYNVKAVHWQKGHIVRQWEVYAGSKTGAKREILLRNIPDETYLIAEFAY